MCVCVCVHVFTFQADQQYTGSRKPKLQRVLLNQRTFPWCHLSTLLCYWLHDPLHALCSHFEVTPALTIFQNQSRKATSNSKLCHLLLVPVNISGIQFDSSEADSGAGRLMSVNVNLLYIAWMLWEWEGGRGIQTHTSVFVFAPYYIFYSCILRQSLPWWQTCCT